MSSAEEFLKQNKLFQAIDEELDKRIVNEKTARKTIFFTACMSFVKNANPTSSNLLLNSSSGSGKDHVTKETLSLFPKKRVLRRTRITPTAFNYWKPVDNWDGHIVYLEDISNSVLNSEVLKVMCSGGSEVTVVRKQIAEDITINGKPTLILTTAHSTPNQENLRRFHICFLDEGQKQTEAVVRNKIINSGTGVVEKYNPEVTNALSKLKVIKVKIPFYNLLLNIIKGNHLIMRTSIDRILDLIKASTALHQFQREQDEAGLFLSTKEDYEHMRDIINSMTKNEYLVPLTKLQLEILDMLKELGCPVTAPELSTKIPRTTKTLRKQLNELAGIPLVKTSSRENEYSHRQEQIYEYFQSLKFELPTWEELLNVENSSFDTSHTFDTFDTLDTFDKGNKGNKSKGNQGVKSTKQQSSSIEEEFYVE